VHYSNRYTGYGLIDAGAQGLSYLTMREEATAGVFWPPQPAGAFPREPRRNLFSEPVLLLTPEQLASLADCTRVVAIEEQPDGVGAWAMRIPAGRVYRPPVAPRGGRFYVVVAGSIAWPGRELQALATLIESPDETGLELQAGQGGAQVAVLQYARPASR